MRKYIDIITEKLAYQSADRAKLFVQIECYHVSYLENVFEPLSLLGVR